MELNLRGRRALVTGASKGIGLAIAQALAVRGLEQQPRIERALQLDDDQVVPFGRRHIAVPHLAAHGVSLRDEILPHGTGEVGLSKGAFASFEERDELGYGVPASSRCPGSGRSE